MREEFVCLRLGGQSIALTVLRQLVLLIPLAFAFSFLGLKFVWLAFPITEIMTAAAGYILYRRYPLKAS